MKKLIKFLIASAIALLPVVAKAAVVVGPISTVFYKDEGVTVSTSPNTIDFVGSGVTVTKNGVSSMTVTITGGGGGLPLTPGDTNYIQNTNTLQSGATFYASSGTVLNEFHAGPGGNSNYSFSIPSYVSGNAELLSTGGSGLVSGIRVDNSGGVQMTRDSGSFTTLVYLNASEAVVQTMPGGRLAADSNGIHATGTEFQFNTKDVCLEDGTNCPPGGGGGGYALEPATVTVLTDKGIRTSTLTVTSQGPGVMYLVSGSSNVETASSGVINTSTNPVDWTLLKNVPAGFADGVDNTGGGGGATITVQDGGSTVVETSTINANADQFVITDDSGKALFTLNSASVTLQGNTLGGDISGTLSAVVVANDSHAHTGATLSGIDISDDTNATANNGVTLTGDNFSVDWSSGISRSDVAAGYQPLDATLTDLAAAPLSEDNSIAVGAIAAGLLPSDVISSSISVGAVGIAQLSATGSPSATTFLRGDNTWATATGSGSSIYPASSTAYFPFGLQTSTIEVTGSGNPVISSTYTQLSIQLTDASDNDFQVNESSAQVSGEHVTTVSNTQSLTNKTYDASATGNVFKKFDYALFTHPSFLANSSTNSFNVSSTTYLFGQGVFNNSVSSQTNCLGYQWFVPYDLDSSATIIATYTYTLGGADTGTHRYVLSVSTVIASGTPVSSLGNGALGVSLDHAGDGSGASGDVEYVTGTLTGWNTGLVGGQHAIIQVCRDGDATEDGSTVNSTSGPLLLRYGITQ